MDFFNLPLLLCAAASTLAFVTITSTSDCSASNCSASGCSIKPKKQRKWKGEGGATTEEQKSEEKILTDTNLKSVLDSGATLFINLHAEDWCGHCKALAPIWNQFSADCGNLQTIKVMKCDADKNTDCSTFFHVESFPTIVLYKDGKISEYKEERTPAGFCKFLKAHCSK